MNLELDLKLAKIRADKQQAKESEKIDNMMHQGSMIERNSGLLMNRRLLNQDDVDIHTSAREFIPIERLDWVLTVEQGENKAVRAFFTVGVVVEVFGPYTAKSGK